jgi:hypothetical protein
MVGPYPCFTTACRTVRLCEPPLNDKARSTMSHEFICSCLHLSAANWPPDHYTLLGLEPGESDPERIERHAQERMEKLRHYQLRHADPVTEAMNRLAQALVCLTDPVAKEDYDAWLLNRDVAQPTQIARSRWPRRTVQRRVFSRGLVLAWILWLAVGVIGLAAMVDNFSAIQASFLGVSAPE